MLIFSKKLAVCPITTHINIKDISKKLKPKLIISKIKTIDFWFKLVLKKKPKIAVLGLNPHNAEFNKRSEEHKFIRPLVKKLKKFSINLSGPYSRFFFY